MSRYVFFFALTLIFAWPHLLLANDDDEPPISISSPDTGSTFAYGTIKQHTLIWDKKNNVLIAHITFTDAEQNSGQPNDDTHDFRLPGVTLDAAKGVFFATSAKGEIIPVAHFKKALFFTVIETLPNAVVRVYHPKGNITVLLQAISPNDPAMHKEDTGDGDGTHKVDIDKVLN